MTGAYLFNKDDNPTEVEYLTKEERHEALKRETPEELLRWIDLLSDAVVMAEAIIKESQDVK